MRAGGTLQGGVVASGTALATMDTQGVAAEVGQGALMARGEGPETEQKAGNSQQGRGKGGKRTGRIRKETEWVWETRIRERKVKREGGGSSTGL